MKPVALLFPVFLVLFNCNNSEKTNIKNSESGEKTEFNEKKPAASNPDTIKIVGPAVVFYSPDSMQLEKIKSITAAQVFESMQHDCFYQQRNARAIIEKNYTRVEIIIAKDARFLSFVSINKNGMLIDLDSNNDPCGLYLFDGIKIPVLADMTNIETAMSNYFEK